MSDDRLPPFDSQNAPPPPPPPPAPPGPGGSGAWGPPVPPDVDADDQEGAERPPSRRSPAAPFSTEPAPIAEPAPVAEPLPEPPPTAFGGQRAGLFDAMPREESAPAPSPFSASAPQPAPPADAPPPAQPPPPDIGQNLGPAPGGPFFQDPPVDGEHDDGGGRPQWLLPVVALVVLLLVGAAFVVVQGLGDDDAESPDETAQTSPTDPTTASTDSTTAPSSEAPATSAEPETTTTSTAVPAEVRVAGVVHLSDQVSQGAAGGSACETLAGGTEVRVNDQGGELIASAPLTSTGELDSRPEGGLTAVTCELRYEIGLPAGSTTPFTFALVSSAGELHDLRIVPADQLNSGTGPFLGTVFVAR